MSRLFPRSLSLRNPPIAVRPLYSEIQNFLKASEPSTPALHISSSKSLNLSSVKMSIMLKSLSVVCIISSTLFINSLYCSSGQWTQNSKGLLFIAATFHDAAQMERDSELSSKLRGNGVWGRKSDRKTFIDRKCLTQTRFKTSQLYTIDMSLVQFELGTLQSTRSASFRTKMKRCMHRGPSRGQLLPLAQSQPGQARVQQLRLSDSAT